MSSVLDTASDIVESVVDVGKEAGDFVGDVISEIDFEDALQTYIQTGDPYAAAWAATPGDEKIGYDYGVKGGSDNDSGGGYSEPSFAQPSYTYEEAAEQPFTIGFETPTLAPGEWELQTGQSNIPSKIIDVFGNIATDYLSGQREAAAQDPASSALAQASSQAVTQSLSNILADVAAGKYAKTPSLSFFEQAAMDTTQQPMGILSRYDTAKANLSNIIRPPGLIAMEGRLGIYEDYFQKRGLI